MTTDDVTIVGVSGGSHALAAAYPHLMELAGRYDATGDQLRRWAGRATRTLADDDLVESAVLSPSTFAAAETAVLATSAGPDGLLTESLAWESDAVLIRVSVASLRATDELVRATFEVLDHLAGRSVGFALSASAPVWLPTAALAWLLWPTLPAALRSDLEARAPGAADRLETWLTDHPAAVQHLVNGGGGLLDGLWDGATPLTPGGPFGVATFTLDTESAAGVLAGLYDDGIPVTVPRDDLSGAASGDQPASVEALLAHLGQVNDLSGDDVGGTIEVQTLTAPDGRTSHVVYLPGTDDLTTLPWTQDGDVRDLGTNFLLVGGADNAYQQGILDAMHQAGIDADEPVLLAGHSQGGMAAAAILSQGSDFDVTHVVTAGSPTAQVDGFPAGSHVLSLENDGDVVPLLDGEDNRDSPEQVTVRLDGGPSGLAGHHGLDTYAAGGAAVDASTAPSLVDQVASLQESGFLGSGATVTSQVFQITRG
ncbi:MAG: hypothetical protein F2667_11670 [Actinobacteria bacterium]|uniref:Unannotated protein n=1 Tax=freshwater metagenome TaxID=449393 RepID=A0A6J6RQM9_9ZZZZ|nr:hypothetical protein [Actinomycetota bacterium]